MRRARPLVPGFTLIEILVVVAIIGMLAGLVVRGLGPTTERTCRARARATISSFSMSLEAYRSDHGLLPGRDSPADPLDPRSNAIAEVVAALRAAEMVRVAEDELGVIDAPGEPPRRPTREEIDDETIPKVLVDPWGNAFVARENESKEEKRPWMRNREFMDIYSLGPNGRDDTTAGAGGQGDDDIGNW